MNAYLYYRSTGNKYSFNRASEEIMDEVEIVLPAEAKEITTADNSRAIELADGQICADLLTSAHDGVFQPYIVDCSGNAGPRRVYLKVKKA